MPGPNRWREKAFADRLFERLSICPEEWTESERPDCYFRLGDKTIGMEITESTPSEKYWGSAIAKSLDCGTQPIVYSTSNLRSHEEQQTRKDLFHNMFNNPSYVDMEEARKWWCEDVRKAWVTKRKKLNEPDYQRYDENWLLIWDNEGLGDNYSTLTNIQSAVLRTPFFDADLDEFDHIYVLSGNFTFDFIPPGKVAFLHERAKELNEWLNPKEGKGGGGQPAAPPESESVGSDKPLLEAEGRFR